MIYKGYEVDSEGKAVTCPRCTNEELDGGNYCKICGLYLINECKNEACGNRCAGNAKCCPVCGSPTTFLQQHLLQEWEEEKTDSEQNFKAFSEAVVKMENRTI